MNQNREYLYILLLSLCGFEPMVSKLARQIRIKCINISDICLM